MIFNEIGEGQLNSIIVRRLSMKVASAAPSVAPELFPNLTLENDRPEWGWLKGELRYSAYVQSPAVVGSFSWFALRNPAGSGLIAVVQRVTCSVTCLVASGFTSPTVLGTSSQGISNDTRQTAGGQCFALTGANVAVHPAGFTSLGRFVANEVNDTPFILAPGAWLLVQHTATNTQVIGDIWWTERPAVTGELG